MDKAKYSIKRIIGFLILLAAIVQWLVVIERGWAAGWAWYKFHDYGGRGYITVGRGSQTIFYILSCVLAFVGYGSSRFPNAVNHATVQSLNRLSRFGAMSLIAGMICWTVLLLSPLVAFR